MGLESIYDVISRSINSEGKLDLNFMLPFKKPSPTEMRFIPGAKDGIGLYHFNLRTPKSAANKIFKLLKSDWKKGDSDSQEKVAEILNRYGSWTVIDYVLHLIRDKQKEIDPKNIFYYACKLAFESTNEELVKLGICLFGLLDLSNEEEIMNRLFILALYEEFTLYVLATISNSPKGNDIVFKIAQKVDGWGKIHAVEYLEPATDEIREWILRKGCANAVMDAYLGLECAIKGDLINALKRDSFDEELFEGISVIIDALLDEGPVDGISVYEHTEEALKLYLRIATEHAFTIIHLWRLLNLQAWLENATISNRDELKKICDNIVNREAWKEMIMEILNKPDDELLFYAINAGLRLNMDIIEFVFRAAKKNPVEHFGYLHILYKNPEYANELTKIYEELLPLDAMAAGMGNFLFPENYAKEHHCLEFILQELKNYPEMGEKLVETGLKSPVVRERIAACKVIEEWSKRLNQNLDTISPGLYAILKEIARIEVDKDSRQLMKKLLRTK